MATRNVSVVIGGSWSEQTPEASEYCFFDCEVVAPYYDDVITVAVGKGEGDLIVNNTSYPRYQISYFVYTKPIIPSTPIDPVYNITPDSYFPPATGLTDPSNIRPTYVYDYSSQYAYAPIFGGGVPPYPRMFSEEPDYYYEDQTAFFAALDAGEIKPNPLKGTVYFDVYINGNDQPIIDVNWTAPDNFSPLLCTPRLWYGVQHAATIGVSEFTEDEEGYTVPNDRAWFIANQGEQSYAGSLSTNYILIYQQFEQYLNAVSKVANWGTDGIPNYIDLYLRMDYYDSYTEETVRGMLHRATILQDGTPTDYEVPDSGVNNFTTVVRFHTGAPDYDLPTDDTDYPDGRNIDDDDTGRYNPDNMPDKSFFNNNQGHGIDDNLAVGGRGVFTIDMSEVLYIQDRLWTQNYFDVLKVQSNPIENIVSLKWFPFALPQDSQIATQTREVIIGDIDMGLACKMRSRVYKFRVGTCKYNGSAGGAAGTLSYLDLQPYTLVKIYLPYCGVVQLDPADIYNATLSVDYIVDLITGDCIAMIELDGIPYLNVNGRIGVDMPLTGSNRIQTELRTASAAASVIGGAAGQMIAGNVGGGVTSGVSGALSIVGAEYNTQRTCSPSSACATYTSHAVFLIIEKPLETVSNAVGFVESDSVGYKHLHGYPCYKYLKLNQLSGFVAVDRRSDLKICMTSEENAMLENLLTGGVFI